MNYLFMAYRLYTICNRYDPDLEFISESEHPGSGKYLRSHRPNQPDAAHPEHLVCQTTR